MPRKRLKTEAQVEYLSILDENGKLDVKLDPKLTDDQCRELHRLMLLTRRLDERCINLQRQGRIGTYGPCRGQEAAHCASGYAMTLEDWVVYAFREPGTAIHRGWPIEHVFQFWGGHEQGCRVPDGVNDLPMCVPIASQIPHGMGIAWGMKLRGAETAVLTYLGDGATSEGDFHEAMNFAGVYRLPLIFLVQNNHWAISIPVTAQTASETIAHKCVAYGFNGIQVDGNDPLAVYAATQEAAQKARSGGGPTLIEAVTYRMSVHTTADDPTKYRSDKEVKAWEGRDPLLRFEKYLKGRKILDDAGAKALDEEVQGEVRAAVDRYDAFMKTIKPVECFDYLFEEMPPELKMQKEELAAAVAREFGK